MPELENINQAQTEKDLNPNLLQETEQLMNEAIDVWLNLVDASKATSDDSLLLDPTVGVNGKQARNLKRVYKLNDFAEEFNQYSLSLDANLTRGKSSSVKATIERVYDTRPGKLNGQNNRIIVRINEATLPQNSENLGIKHAIVFTSGQKDGKQIYSFNFLRSYPDGSQQREELEMGENGIFYLCHPSGLGSYELRFANISARTQERYSKSLEKSRLTLQSLFPPKEIGQLQLPKRILSVIR